MESSTNISPTSTQGQNYWRLLQGDGAVNISDGPNITAGNSSVAIGRGNSICRDHSVVIGDSNRNLKGENTLFVGTGLHTTDYYCRDKILVGEYNSEAGAATGVPFAVAWGTYNSGKDIFYITEDGNAVLAGTLTQASDKRLKEHIEYIDGDDAAEFINAIKPAIFIKNNERHMGLSAQDVQEADK